MIHGEIQLPKMEGMEVSPGIILMAEPTPIDGSTGLRCLANVYGTLAIVELKLTFGRREAEACRASPSGVSP